MDLPQVLDSARAPASPGDGSEGVTAGAEEIRPVWANEEIALAIDRYEVTFSMVLRTSYLQWSAPTPYLRDSYRKLHRPVLEQFMMRNGGIRESFYVTDFAAGVVLTGSWRLFADVWWDAFKFDTSAARELEAEFNELRLKASEYLDEKHRRVCMEHLLRLYKGLYSSLHLEWRRWMGPHWGKSRAPHAAHIADIAELRRELKRVTAIYERAGMARGLARYSAGAAAGALAIVLVAGIAAAVIGSDDHTVWLGAVAAGALGGLFSVLERLTRRALTVRFEAERPVLSGTSRPVVGAIAGVALFALVEGTIVPLDVPQDYPAHALFFAGLAFLAGFSERLAKDVFGSAASSLGGTRQETRAAGQVPQDGPSNGGTAHESDAHVQ
jgi:hypothetical protein